MYSAVKDTTFESEFSLNFKGNLRVYKQPIVMGIINATPDSFYTESRSSSVKETLSTVEKMISEGVDILDIGGYSSRPGASDISTEEELDRVVNLIKELKLSFPSLIISIDTFRSEVAKQSVLAGADMINDISGGVADPKIFKVASNFSAPICLMHMRGTPQTMQNNTSYKNIYSDIINYFSTQIKLAKTNGVKDIIIDPGFGFSKSIDQNYKLIKQLNQFSIFNLPIIVGISRKSMIYKHLEITANESLNATTALNTISLMNGAKILRVHDVKAAKEAIQIYSKTVL